MPKAKADTFAVGPFNMNNLEFAQATVEAAIDESCNPRKIRLFGSNNQA